MSASEIEWTEQTWNPVTGCAQVSAGCKHCYAERMALRLRAMAAPGYARGFELTLHADRLDQPLRRKKPTVYFVGSVADLFHEEVPDAFVDRVLATIRQTPRHTDLLLTKRAERLADFFANRPVPGNVWLGVTVEDRRYGLPRIEPLRRVPARVRFLAVEPLLEDLGPLDLGGIQWVIVGGESVPGRWRGLPVQAVGRLGVGRRAPRPESQRKDTGRAAVGRAAGVERGAAVAGRLGGDGVARA